MAKITKDSQPLINLLVPNSHVRLAAVPSVRNPYDFSQKIQPACNPIGKCSEAVRW